MIDGSDRFCTAGRRLGPAISDDPEFYCRSRARSRRRDGRGTATAPQWNGGIGDRSVG